MAIMLVAAVAVVAQSRGTPISVQASKAVTAPVIAEVPQMIGYDVIQNISEPRALISAQNIVSADTSARLRLSSTRAVRTGFTANLLNTRPAPVIVMLA